MEVITMNRKQALEDSFLSVKKHLMKRVEWNKMTIENIKKLRDEFIMRG